MLRERRRQAAIARIRALLDESNYDEMVRATRREVQRFPDDPEIRLLHGTALIWVEDESAAHELAQAVALDPDDVGRLVRAGSLLLHLGHVAAARSYIDRAKVLADPHNTPLWEVIDDADGSVAAAEAAD